MNKTVNLFCEKFHFFGVPITIFKRSKWSYLIFDVILFPTNGIVLLLIFLKVRSMHTYSDNDLLDIMMKTSEGKLSDVDLKINGNKALCVVLSAGGYPESYDKGDEITISDMDSVVFHAGTKKVDGKIVTNGGRVLNIVNSKKNFDDVIKACYEDIEKVDFKNMYHRTDIGPRVKRVYVRKKDEYDYESKEKKKQIENLLGIDLDKFVIYKRYDLEISDDNLKRIVDTVLSEKSVDDVFYGEDALKLQADMKNAISL